MTHSESDRAWIIKSMSPSEHFGALGMTVCYILYGPVKMEQEVENGFELEG